MALPFESAEGERRGEKPILLACSSNFNANDKFSVLQAEAVALQDLLYFEI